MKGHGTVLIVICSVLLAITLCTAGLGGYTIIQLRALRETVQQSVKEETTSEDDVTIAEQYTIRSTKAISDAYLSHSTAGLDDKQKETLSMASEVLKKIITYEMTTDYEREVAVYRWMIDSLSPDEGMLTVIPTTTADADNPYGTLKYHNAVCVGFATTFRMFMQMLEIPCMVVHNTEAYHSWDLVQLDGNWYHADVYSGMSGRFRYLNLSDAMLEKEQSWDRSFFPAALSSSYYYPARNAETLTSPLELPEVIRKSLGSGKKEWSFRFVGLSNHDILIAQEVMAQLTQRLSLPSAYEGEEVYDSPLTAEWVALSSKELLLCLSLSVDVTDPDADILTDEDYNDIYDSINDALGSGDITLEDLLPKDEQKG